MSIAPRASACAPADVEAWLAELGLDPLERADREGVTSWDLRLDGTRRAALRVTLILDPALALICWAHYAPPIGDAFRKSYRQLPALERRAAVREVLRRRGRAAPAARRDPGRAREPSTRWGSRSPASSRSRTACTTRRLHWLKAAGLARRPAAARARWTGPGVRLVARYAAAARRAAGAGRRRGRAPAGRPERGHPPALAAARWPPRGSVTALARSRSGRRPASRTGPVRPGAREHADLTLVTNATYTVQPGATAGSPSSVAITARNHTVETKTRRFSSTTRSSPSSRAPPGSGSRACHGATVRVAKTTKDARLLRIGFGAGCTAARPRRTGSRSTCRRRARARTRRSGSGRASSRCRSGRSRPTARAAARRRVRFPAGWDVAVESGSFAQRATTSDGGTLLATGPLAQPLAFFAFVSAPAPGDLPRDAARRPGRRRRGATSILRAWTDDPRWGEADRRAADAGAAGPRARTSALPVAARRAARRPGGGQPRGRRVRRAVRPRGEPDRGRVLGERRRRAPRGGPRVVQRRRSSPTAGRPRGSRPGTRSAPPTELEREGQRRRSSRRPLRLAAIPLDTWAPAGAGDRARQTYGYAASYELAAALAERVGPEALAARLGGRGRSHGAPTSRRPGRDRRGDRAGARSTARRAGAALLDLIEAESGTNVTDLFRTWVVDARRGGRRWTPARPPARLVRAHARSSPATGRCRAAIRDALRAWDFATAERHHGGRADRARAADRPRGDRRRGTGVTLPDDLQAVVRGRGPRRRERPRRGRAAGDPRRSTAPRPRGPRTTTC